MKLVDYIALLGEWLYLMLDTNVGRISVYVIVGKSGCLTFSYWSLFVVSANRKDAEDALQKLQGTVLGKQTVRLSWGRNPGNKQVNLVKLKRMFIIKWLSPFALS